MFPIFAFTADKAVARPDGTADAFGVHTVTYAESYPASRDVVLVAAIQVEDADQGTEQRWFVDFVDSKNKVMSTLKGPTLNIPKFGIRLGPKDAVMMINPTINLKVDGHGVFLLILRCESGQSIRIPYSFSTGIDNSFLKKR